MKIKNSKQFIINNDEVGKRIDNFLLTRFKNIPKSKIYRIIRKGEVRINSGRIKPKYKIQEGDLLRIPFLEMRTKKTIVLHKFNQINLLMNNILYEDEYLLILNKPSGMAVHGGTGIQFGIIETLRVLRSETYFLELVHRLDRDTSGILLIAKKLSALRALHEQLRMKKMQKEYLALVKGQWPSHIKVIEKPLSNNVFKHGQRIVQVSSNGKHAETNFKIKERFVNTTLLKVIPITGKKHQIRVHTQYVKHPIIFDHRYGDFNFNEKLHFTGLKRIFLHANILIFTHPSTGEKLSFKAPLDEQLKTFLIKLRKELKFKKL
ncbi:23S rRNA pseudouridine(955/2504/2580) synthase RluC [Arsenophonus symbiont of Ornithomya chloropus]|uniref:23S rRNA pseudouridine(955/2504/2580) synthase RluC n=1 Tax=Arsenophonus symbiont of Ornithomya chloropus TaxID=634121 RepID=UPI0032B142A1